MIVRTGDRERGEDVRFGISTNGYFVSKVGRERERAARTRRAIRRVYVAVLRTVKRSG